MSNVMVGAATALAQALKTPTAAGSPTPVTLTSTATYSHQLSPNNKDVANAWKICVYPASFLMMVYCWNLNSLNKSIYSCLSEKFELKF